MQRHGRGAFNRKISGEIEEDMVTEEEVAEALAEEENGNGSGNGNGTLKKTKGAKRKKRITVVGMARSSPSCSPPTRKCTIRSDTEFLAEAESDDPNCKKQDYTDTHLRTIEFQIARLIVGELAVGTSATTDNKRRVLRFQPRAPVVPAGYSGTWTITSRGR